MRYAVPITDGKVSLHFGHCESFALIDVDEAARKIVNKKLVTPPEHQPGVLPAWLAEEGVNIVIAGGMGSRAQNLFSENRIEVIVGSMEGDPEEVVLSHLHGALETGDNVCDH
jgi:ATP-binding protein involved in chromosome partitioning